MQAREPLALQLHRSPPSRPQKTHVSSAVQGAPVLVAHGSRGSVCPEHCHAVLVDVGTHSTSTDASTTITWPDPLSPRPPSLVPWATLPPHATSMRSPGSGPLPGHGKNTASSWPCIPQPVTEPSVCGATSAEDGRFRPRGEDVPHEADLGEALTPFSRLI
jgi:hypothetical protein